MVVTFKLSDAFPLGDILSSQALGPNVHLTGKQWLGLRVGPHRRYVAVYPNGKILVAGCRTIQETSEVLREVAGKLLSYVKFPTGMNEPSIHNIVATDDLRR